MPSGIAMLACCLLSAFLCGVAPARAQDAAAAKAEHPVAIPVADILSRADAIDSRLTRSMRHRCDPRPRVPAPARPGAESIGRGMAIEIRFLTAYSAANLDNQRLQPTGRCST